MGSGVIVRKDNKVWAASDRSRFFTLFYSINNGSFSISDNFYELIKNTKTSSINELSKFEFLSNAITCNKRTLIDEIKQIRPCDAIEYYNEKIQHQYFHTVATTKTEYFSDSFSVLKRKGYEVFEIARERLQNSLKNKKVLLPLSSGFDSRLIACWLKSSGIENVTCFTFGRMNAPEVETSKNIANKLNYKWINIEYNSSLIVNFEQDEYFHEYYKYLSRGTSMFYMQEYFAIRELVKKGIATKDHVVIPGHASGFLAGNNLVRTLSAWDLPLPADPTMLRYNP